MKKIEFIWREILYQTIEKRRTRFQQQALAAQFNLSSSTVHASLVPLRTIGAVDVGGRGFTVMDYEKILYHWANHHRIHKNIKVSLSISLPVKEIEGLLPARTIPTVYTAYSERFGEPPVDYEAVWCYHPQPQEMQERFSGHIGKGKPNLFVIPADPFLSRYGKTTLACLFVDLWQMHDWYAKDFTKKLKEHIDGLLS